MRLSDFFVRFLTALLEALIRSHLFGSELLIVLWVVRETFGWNRQWTPFRWYRVARELTMNRSAVYRTGRVLLRSGILAERDGQITIDLDCDLWNGLPLNPMAGERRQPWLP